MTIDRQKTQLATSDQLSMGRREPLRRRLRLRSFLSLQLQMYSSFLRVRLPARHAHWAARSTSKPKLPQNLRLTCLRGQDQYWVRRTESAYAVVLDLVSNLFLFHFDVYHVFSCL